MLEKPTFLQGVYRVQGGGFDSPAALQPAINYRVPFDKRAQLVYFRGGNSCASLVSVLLLKDGKPMRYFPIGAQQAIHVPLAVVEDLHPDTVLEVLIAAPQKTSGTLILDIGLVEF